MPTKEERESRRKERKKEMKILQEKCLQCGYKIHCGGDKYVCPFGYFNCIISDFGKKI